jgi:hypothetical protein
MQARTQLILKQLGIRQWLARDSITRAVSTGVLWRDQHCKQSQPVTATSSDDGQAMAVSTVPEHSAHPPLRVVDLPPAEQIHSITTPVRVGPSDTLPRDDLRLDYQVLIHDRFILLAEVGQQQHMQLLTQIANGCHAQQQPLTWPLAIANWPWHDQVASAYLQGYFYQHQHKTLVLLGDCGFDVQARVNFQQTLSAASLQQMLDSPTDKWALWQMLYPHVYQLESKDEKEGRDI